MFARQKEVEDLQRPSLYSLLFFSFGEREREGKKERKKERKKKEFIK